MENQCINKANFDSIRTKGKIPMPEQPATVVLSTLTEKMDEAKESALYEIKELKADLVNLEKIISGRKKQQDVSILDIINSAFELYRHSQVFFENKKLIETIENDMAEALATDQLITNGAQLLKKPAGWHWISPKGEMFHLGDSAEPVAASKKLNTLLKRRKKKAATKDVDDQPQAEVKDEKPAEEAAKE